MSVDRKELLLAIQAVFDDEDLTNHDLAILLMETAQQLSPGMIELVEETEELH